MEKVRNGTFPMAVVPARAWSTAGVKSLRALQAPFLVQSDEHMVAIVRDPAITEQAFAGLGGVGVTGLTLFPSELRHFFSFTDPILTPADLKGRRIRVFGSLDTSVLVESLDGVAVDLDDEAFNAGVADGTVTAFDTGFATGGEFIGDPGQPEAANAAANLVPYAGEDLLVGGEHLLLAGALRRAARHRPAGVNSDPRVGHRQPEVGGAGSRGILR